MNDKHPLKSPSHPNYKYSWPGARVSHYSSGDRPLDHRSACLNRDPSFPSGPHLVFTFSQNTLKIFSPAEEYRQDNKERILVGSWLLGNSSAYLIQRGRYDCFQRMRAIPFPKEDVVLSSSSIISSSSGIEYLPA
jgi:hypothetical protein